MSASLHLRQPVVELMYWLSRPIHACVDGAEALVIVTE
jgi:hypothetical protein